MKDSEKQTLELLKNELLEPFKKLLPLSSSVLMSHARITVEDDPSYCDSSIPACISKFWVTKVLREDSGFDPTCYYHMDYCYNFHNCYYLRIHLCYMDYHYMDSFEGIVNFPSEIDYLFLSYLIGSSCFDYMD